MTRNNLDGVGFKLGNAYNSLCDTSFKKGKKMNKNFFVLSLIMGGALVGCGGSSSDGAITDFKSGFSAISSSLDAAVPEADEAAISQHRGLIKPLASLEDVWNDPDYGVEASNPLSTTIINYFSPRSEDNYYSFRGRISESLLIPCIAAYYIGTSSGTLLNEGTTDATLDSDDIDEIQDLCPAVDDDFLANVNGTDARFVVTDVSRETGSLYNQKMTLSFSGDSNIDVVYYFKIDNDLVRFLQAEIKDITSEHTSNSTTAIVYNPSTGAISAEYLTGVGTEFNEHAANDEGIRLFSDGTDVHWYSFMWKDSNKFSTIHYSYKLDSPSEFSASVYSNTENSLTNASACILFSDYSIRRDNSVACEVSGKPASTYKSFVKNTLSQTDIDYHSDHSSSRTVSFSTLAGMYSVEPE